MVSRVVDSSHKRDEWETGVFVVVAKGFYARARIYSRTNQGNPF
jgi:hypothetical protein